MKFVPFGRYKPSGVDWVGDLPVDWDITEVKRVFEIKKRIAGSLGFDVLSVTQKGIVVKDIESGDGQLSMDYSKYQIVEIGDFAMNHMDLLTGYVDIAAIPGVTSPDYRVFAARRPGSCNQRFFLYVFQMAYKQKLFFPFGQGSSQLGRWRLPTDAFNAFLLPLPSGHEQDAIVAFLDRETAQIDTLITKQEELIELLKEKRQAVISHAITNGLDSNVPTKPSGVEWLGNVPVHWTICKLRRSVEDHKQGYYSSDPYVDDGVKLLRITDLSNDGTASFENCPMVENKNDVAAFRLQTGDFVFARTGGAGIFALLEDLTEDVVFASYLIRFRFSASLAVNYLRYFFRSNCFQDALRQNIHGGVNQNVHAEDIKEQWIAIPTEPEQASIAAFLDAETAKIDALIAKAQQAIELQKEHRTALISAAVTGKIDVRNQADVKAAA